MIPLVENTQGCLKIPFLAVDGGCTEYKYVLVACYSSGQHLFQLLNNFTPEEMIKAITPQYQFNSLSKITWEVKFSYRFCGVAKYSARSRIGCSGGGEASFTSSSTTRNFFWAMYARYIKPSLSNRSSSELTWQK